MFNLEIFDPEEIRLHRLELAEQEMERSLQEGLEFDDVEQLSYWLSTTYARSRGRAVVNP